MPNSVGGVNSNYNAEMRKKAATKSNGNDMSVDSFLQMLAAQLQNQDMMNPMKDTDFMGQLAQFTSLQTMQEMNMVTSTSYALSLVGKEATGATIDARGNLVAKTGTITGVSLFNGEPVFYIGDFGFYLNQLMSVGKVPDNKDSEGDDDSNATITPPIHEGPEFVPTPPINEVPDYIPTPTPPIYDDSSTPTPTPPIAK